MVGHRRVLLRLSLWALAVILRRFLPVLMVFHDYYLFCSLCICHINKCCSHCVSSKNKSEEKIEAKTHKLDDSDVQRDIYLPIHNLLISYSQYAASAWDGEDDRRAPA